MAQLQWKLRRSGCQTLIRLVIIDAPELAQVGDEWASQPIEALLGVRLVSAQVMLIWLLKPKSSAEAKTSLHLVHNAAKFTHLLHLILLKKLQSHDCRPTAIFKSVLLSFQENSCDKFEDLPSRGSQVRDGQMDTSALRPNHPKKSKHKSDFTLSSVSLCYLFTAGATVSKSPRSQQQHRSTQIPKQQDGH